MCRRHGGHDAVLYSFNGLTFPYERFELLFRRQRLEFGYKVGPPTRKVRKSSTAVAQFMYRNSKGCNQRYCYVI